MVQIFPSVRHNGIFANSGRCAPTNDFWSIEDAQELAAERLWSYNHERLHSAIGGIPPAKLLAKMSVSTERAP